MSDDLFPELSSDPRKRYKFHSAHSDSLFRMDMHQDGDAFATRGEGVKEVASWIKDKSGKAYDYLKENAASLAKKGYDFYGTDTAKDIINLFPDSDDTARPQYAGEKHAVLKLKNGKYGFANYAGPGTSLIKRLKNDDPPRTYVDKISKVHDIGFALARNPEDVRAADRRMLKNLDRAGKEGLDSPFNIKAAHAIIRAKTVAEDVGLLKKGSFASMSGNQTPEEKKLLEDNLKVLTQEGLGYKPSPQELLLEKVMSGDGLRLRGKGQATDENIGDSVDKSMSIKYNRLAGLREGRGPTASMIADTLSGMLTNVITKGIKGSGGLRLRGAGRKQKALKVSKAKLYKKLYSHFYNKLSRKKQKHKLGGAFDWKSLLKSAAKAAVPLLAKQFGFSPEQSEKAKEWVDSFLTKYVGSGLRLRGKGAYSGCGLSQEDLEYFASEFGDGFTLGWNATKDALKDVPKVGDIASKLPSLPGPKNLDDLKKRSAERTKKYKEFKKAEYNRVQADKDTEAQKGQKVTDAQKAAFDALRARTFK